MSYIGRGVDAISNVEKLDNITFNGGTTYALTKSSAAFTPVGANNILISIDGVIQQGNFSVSTTNIVFDFSPTSSNTCDFVLHYGTGVLNVPADGAVSTAKIADDAVTLAKMAGLARGKIIYGDASGNPAALTVGSNTQVLKSDGTDISWGTDSGGAALTGSTNNTITTVTGANAIQGEANLTYDGTTFKVASGAVIIEPSSGATSLTIGSGANDVTNSILFPNDAQSTQGSINYVVASDTMNFKANSNGQRMAITSAGVDVTGTLKASSGIGVINTKDLGVGLHIKTADSGASVDGGADELVIEGSGHAGMTIASGTGNSGTVYFADSGGTYRGYVEYSHNTDKMTIGSGASASITCDADGHVTQPRQSAFSAHSTPVQTVGSTNDTTVVLGTEVFDQNADFASNTFTAPVTGRYQLNGLATVTDLDDEYCYFQIVTSNRTYGGVHQVPSTSGAEYEMMPLSCLADMDAGDTAYLNVNSEADTSFDLRGGECEFTGFLAC